jgi:hypothetical protein
MADKAPEPKANVILFPTPFRPSRVYALTPEQVEEYCRRSVQADEIRWGFK